MKINPSRHLWRHHIYFFRKFPNHAVGYIYLSVLILSKNSELFYFSEKWKFGDSTTQIQLSENWNNFEKIEIKSEHSISRYS